ncbi:MAG TPA: sensor histidine kinase [Chloroflexota bacterium]|nr:sensor histidine kinase [Chloroflexota bacterium]
MGQTSSAAWHRRLLLPWRHAGLRTKIFLGYLLLITIPLTVVAIAAYQTSTTTIEGNAQNFSAQLTGEIRDNLDTYALQAERLTYWPFQANNVRRVLAAYQHTPVRPPNFYDVITMRNELSYLGHSRDDISGIYVVTTNGTLFSWTASGDLVRRPPTLGAPWYAQALSADPRVVFLPTQAQGMIAVATGNVVSLVAVLHDPTTGARLGAVRVDLDARAVAGVVQRVSLGTQGHLLVLSPQGALVYPIDSDSASVGLARAIAGRRQLGAGGRLRLTHGGQDLLVTYDTSQASGWIVAGVVPTAHLLTGANYLRAFILTVAALCILMGALGAALAVAGLTRPLRQLKRAMAQVEAQRDFATRVDVKSEDEVGQLAHGFNTMIDEIQRLVDDVLRAQLHEREAELHALQSQIKPHFLYNTLESINMLALTHGDREVSRMVTSLGRLLRHAIGSGEPLISVREELEHVHHYMVVQHMRFGDRITITIEVDPQLLDGLIPRLALQPLVENALTHGLEPRPGPGWVTVRGSLVGSDLMFTVEDNGMGMDAGTLAGLRARLEEDLPRDGRSIGLANVHRRIHLHCGMEYGLSVESLPGEGTRVIMRVPRLAPARDRETVALSGAG